MSLKLGVVWGVIFVLLFGFFSYITVRGYRIDLRISEDPVYGVAQIDSFEKKTEYSGGQVSDTYHITYVYEAGGIPYMNRISLEGESGKSVIDLGGLPIVYNRQTPEVHKMKYQYQSDRNINGLYMTLVKMLLGCAFISFLVVSVIASKLRVWKKARMLQAQAEFSQNLSF